MTRLAACPASRHRRHRGVALLIVLAALVLTATACATLARVASAGAAARRLAADARAADELCTAAEGPITEWLVEKAARAVLPPGDPLPAIELLHERWGAGTAVCELRLVAFDQYGMVPISSTRSGSPLWLTLPPTIAAAADAVTVPAGSRAGLDLVDPSLGAVFPALPATVARVFGAPEGGAPPPLDPHDGPALGGLVATHNPAPRRGAAPVEASSIPPPPRINVNTAPMPLVEAAARLAGRGGVEAVVRARAAGKPAMLSVAPRDAAGDPDGAPLLVGQSDCWAVRIDARVGVARRSWWAVYARTSSTSWECVQRLAVTD